MNADLQLMIQALPFLGQAAFVTFILSIGSIFGALVVGLVIAIFRITDIKILRSIGRVYVSFFRGTPLLIQLFIWYYGLTSFHIVLSPWEAAYIGLSLHYGAYISESLRAAILSISKGQWEASYSLGMSGKQTFRNIILPQAWRRSIPPVFNSLIDVVKSSSLASVLTVPELTYVGDEVSAAAGFVIFPILMETALIYWGFTTVINIIQSRLEHKLRF
ncbi:MAG TPA: amino acid ABC transporter permease [Bacillales bacterium]|nr:amino acid ABC transporter permease [Bacillales bacterium]